MTIVASVLDVRAKGKDVAGSISLSFLMGGSMEAVTSLELFRLFSLADATISSAVEIREGEVALRAVACLQPLTK